jgi:alkylation response protein AidB-like acyl-CoA dehydrogenase
MNGPSLSSAVGVSGPFGAERAIVSSAKKIALFCLGVAYQRFAGEIEEQQEILAALTDISMNTFAMESAVLRSQKMAAAGKGEAAAEMTAVFTREAMEIVESSARAILAACGEGDSLRMNLAILKRFAKHEPVNSIALRRKIAVRLLDTGRYVV